MIAEDLSSNKEIIEKLKQRKNIQPQKLKVSHSFCFVEFQQWKHLIREIEYKNNMKKMKCFRIRQMMMTMICL
jgi:hypothetical protein